MFSLLTAFNLLHAAPTELLEGHEGFLWLQTYRPYGTNEGKLYFSESLLTS